MTGVTAPGIASGLRRASGCGGGSEPDCQLGVSRDETSAKRLDEGLRVVGLSLPGMPACGTRRYGVTRRRDVLLTQRGAVILDVEGRVRVAELVAALSLGIDLGFGQPMEHVLRQCLIALRLAERAGLDEESRGAVYYTALLVNVGCHTDAHEQAKWFGDDIAMKSRKYDYDMRSVRGAAAAMRFLGAGHPPLHRFRLGIEFAISGHREVDGMIDHHAEDDAAARRAARPGRRGA